MEDKTLVCVDCGEEFVFTVGEQEFYKEKDLKMILRDVQNVEKQRKQLNKTESSLKSLKATRFILWFFLYYFIL